MRALLGKPAEMRAMMYIWVFLGAIVLAVAIAWAMLNNRQSAKGLRDTERATHDIYQAEDNKNKEAGR